jgi:integrase
VIVSFSVKAGLRAGEVAKLTWDMLIDPAGNLGRSIELRDWATKKRGGRRIPIHPSLPDAVLDLKQQTNCDDPVIESERGGPMSSVGIVNWFAASFRAIGFEGCSSHAGRRTSVTRAARLVHQAVDHCAMFSCWPATDQFKRPSATSTATATRSASSFH